ncbi:unnamed protein product (macronuclear) [Paramecium tetraurelia]|uniref:Uncharacterized protein n=1 Tax=Paramecium tetraurelia TaxID=5888 RepID=A0E9Y0_PARTE|nr:uncharacterized protein GSPATT00024828001 [Paramecium tetraurelia]CAK92097.1 unnamed protein product [Paramecium tetraurelia]|eukprot:XP_001459494.1 hypothetical protein (macronuclear) [Paramecium tetraurelia strain d4-2]
MIQLSSVERTTMIELFSTFFDRLSSHNSQREQMLKSLYQFKALLYANDPGIEKYLHDLQGQKSPLKRDNSQTKKSSSVRKEQEPIMRHPKRKTLGCGHEIDVVDSSGECLVCTAQSPFDEFKSKCANVFKVLQSLDNDDFFRTLQQLDDPLTVSLSKQRCQSSTGELFKDPMNYSRMALAEQQTTNIQQIIRKCLRCNKDIQNHDSKNISYFCNSCKNF